MLKIAKKWYTEDNKDKYIKHKPIDVVKAIVKKVNTQLPHDKLKAPK